MFETEAQGKVANTSLIVEARNLKKNYNSFEALKGIDLELRTGSCLALLGPNGAGKSTAVEIIAGLKKADSGYLKIFGLDWSSSKQKIYSKLGVQLQETNLYKKFTIFETLKLFSSFYQEKDRCDLNELIDSFELNQYLNKRLEQVSGGIKQRLYIACALIHNPDLVILDEPTTGLDPQSRRFLWGKIEELKSQNKAVLLTTHYMEEAEKLADNVIIVDKGEVIAAGSPTKLIDQYCVGSRVELETLTPDENLSNFITENLLASTIQKDQNLWVIVLKNPYEDILKIKSYLNKHQNDVKYFSVVAPNLEDVFINLTGKKIRDD